MKTNQELLELLDQSLNNLVEISGDAEATVANIISLERQIKDHITTMIKLNEELSQSQDVIYTVEIKELIKSDEN